MSFIGIKNKTNRPYSGMCSGRAYDFKPGEAKLLPIDVAKHLSENSQYSAVGEKYLHVIPVENLGAEVKRDPRTILSNMVRVINPGKTQSQTMWDAKEYLIPAGGSILVPEDVAQEIGLRDRTLILDKNVVFNDPARNDLASNNPAVAREKANTYESHKHREKKS